MKKTDIYTSCGDKLLPLHLIFAFNLMAIIWVIVNLFLK